MLDRLWSGVEEGRALGTPPSERFKLKRHVVEAAGKKLIASLPLYVE